LLVALMARSCAKRGKPRRLYAQRQAGERNGSVLSWRSAAVSERPAAAGCRFETMFAGALLRLVLRTQPRSLRNVKLDTAKETRESAKGHF
jgi:hypothetical protein